MRTLTPQHIVYLHRSIIQSSGGSFGIRDQSAIESAAAQPHMSFGETDLYPDLPSKAAAMAHTLISGHPFVDGNKRVGHAALEAMLVLNGHEISAEIDEQERVILAVASGTLSRDEFIDWIRSHTVKLER
jgi:death on curing protein